MEHIFFYTEGSVAYPACFSEARVCAWLKLMAVHYGCRLGDLNFIFCDDDYILSVNRQYLNHDYYTDVITFDYCRGKLLSGDVFISLDTVKSNANQFSVTFDEEFHRVICHSVLHLIGFKDKTEPDSKLMRENENICLELLKTL